MVVEDKILYINPVLSVETLLRRMRYSRTERKRVYVTWHGYGACPCSLPTIRNSLNLVSLFVTEGTSESEHKEKSDQLEWIAQDGAIYKQNRTVLGVSRGGEFGPFFGYCLQSEINLFYLSLPLDDKGTAAVKHSHARRRLCSGLQGCPSISKCPSESCIVLCREPSPMLHLLSRVHSRAD